MNFYGAQPTGIMATMPMDAQAAMGQFAITDPDSPMGIESLAGGQEELAQRLQAMGVPQYGLGKYFRKFVPKELRRVSQVVVPIVLTSMGQPHLAAAYSGTMAKLEGASTKDALFAAGKTYVGAKIGGIESLSGTQQIMAQAAANVAIDKARGMETDDALRGALQTAAVQGFLKSDLGKPVSNALQSGVSGIQKGIGNLFGGADPAAASTDLTTGLGEVEKVINNADSVVEANVEALDITAPKVVSGDAAIDAATKGMFASSSTASDVTPATDSITENVIDNFETYGLEDAVNNVVTKGMDPISIQGLPSEAGVVDSLANSPVTADLLTYQLPEVSTTAPIGEIDPLDKALTESFERALQGGTPLPIDEIDPNSPMMIEAAEKALAEYTPEQPGFFSRLRENLSEGFDEFMDKLLFRTDKKGIEALVDFGEAAAIPAGALAVIAGMSMDDIQNDTSLSEEQKQMLIEYIQGTSGDPKFSEQVKPVIDFYADRRANQGIQTANEGGEIVGPGTGTSDSVPALLSDGEFVMTAKAVRNAGGGNREKGAAKMYALMNKLEKGAA